MIIPDNCSQVNLVFVGDNLPTGAQVTFGVGNDSDFSPTAVGDKVIEALVAAQVMDLFGDDEAITTVHVKNGPNATGPFADVATDLPGALTSNITSPNVSLLVKKNTALGGRQGQGRMYWPGISEATIGSDGTIDGAFLTSAAGIFGTWLEELTTELIPMLLLHNNAVAPNAVTSLAVQAVGATQRRRLRR